MRDSWYTGLKDDYNNKIHNEDVVDFLSVDRYKINPKRQIGIVYFDETYNMYCIKDYDTKLTYQFSEVYHLQVVGSNRLL